MKVPPEAIETVRSIFLRANRAATRMLSEAPNTWETSLDMAIITALNQYSAPIQPVRDCLVSIQTHFFGGRRLYERWEIADIGLLVTHLTHEQVQQRVVAFVAAPDRRLGSL